MVHRRGLPMKKYSIFHILLLYLFHIDIHHLGYERGSNCRSFSKKRIASSRASHAPRGGAEGPLPSCPM
ncbi:unnamed protein product [Chondrus crispus]|uniref:Uncharacterized protein n=1 Tax=Chondrus crispus TaxID=2769 RepID=R7Q4Z2_CHOCR|nr:unnamed protein product [Chondrus crispus]CDF32933.1 unnamed protein product [Chondrus crispus]|eukprot:XP_005712736.1 unnamed protein product [Chondrus crispus]